MRLGRAVAARRSRRGRTTWPATAASMSVRHIAISSSSMDSMTDPNAEKLVVAISSRALFDLAESHDLFEREGLEAYRGYQMARENEPLEPGIAFPLVQKLLRLNAAAPEAPRVE